MTITHTYAILTVSKQTFEEIKKKLAAAEYDDQFHKIGNTDKIRIDMHGIALEEEEK